MTSCSACGVHLLTGGALTTFRYKLRPKNFSALGVQAQSLRPLATHMQSRCSYYDDEPF